MADMTHKHHNLIYDAIKEASAVFVRSTEVQQMVNEVGQHTRATTATLVARRLNRAFVRALAQRFANKLRYTNDKFDATVWMRQVEAIADEIFDDFEKENA